MEFSFIDASYRYQTLELTEESPKLPAGYLSLVPLLLVPPLWRWVMDPVLRKYKEQWAEKDRRIGQSKTSLLALPVRRKEKLAGNQ